MIRALALIACSVYFLAASAAFAQSGDAARGEHLARGVAMCVQCHSPRDAGGEIVESRIFLGAPLPVRAEGNEWAFRAPRIARIPGYTEESFVRFLETGKRRDGSFARKPMPPFRMSRQEALDIAAYLKSLGVSGTN